MSRTVILVLVLCSLLFTVSKAHGGAYSADEAVIGRVRSHTVKKGESLMEIARRFDLGFNEIAEANPGLDPFVPGKGAKVVIPASWIVPDAAPADGIVINLSEMRLYYFVTSGDERLVITFPIGIGSEENDTPVGEFRLIQKIEDPSWHVPASIMKEKPELPRVVPPGPDNPLGSHAMRLSERDILIHGTNKPWGVGRKVSHGCIRLYPEDIPYLFERVPVGARVTIVRQPVKVGVKGGKVYIEAHRDQFENIDYFNEATGLLIKNNLLNGVNAQKLFQAIGERKGIPVDISK
ncbi:MAG: ErfK/YbiS/YcfS/YnhG family [Geobacteraceae bacterium]|nr:MAG: ErfK/YbiS/YcfS/YnhG family [Geobacteraceae bacterium]